MPYSEPVMYMTYSDYEDLQNSDGAIYAYFDRSEVPCEDGEEIAQVAVMEDQDFEDIYVAEEDIGNSTRVSLHSSPILDGGGLAIPVDVRFIGSNK